jgi:hypothetical protein
MSLTCCKASSIAWCLGGLLVIGGGTVAALHFLGVFRPAETPVQAGDAGTLTERVAVRVPAVRFTDITREAGIRFHHHNGATEKKLLPETMGAGVAVLDFDNDGKPDLLFINGRPWPGRETSVEKTPTLALYHNEGGGKFTDATESTGLAVMMFGMGATVGDYDNDSWPDLFVTGVGDNRLFHNEAGAGGRRFVDVTATAGVGGPGGWPEERASDFFSWNKPIGFSSSAAFVDYDGDGKLDLFVCNYVRWSPAFDLSIGSRLDGRERTYGQPKQFEGALCLLYHNEGNGRFTDVSRESGVQVREKLGIDASAPERPLGKSLGVIGCDADEDGWPDIVVANDSVRNFFFHNQPGPRGTRIFKEMGQRAGIAYAQGQARGAMGIDWAPYYRPGCNALLIGNFADEPDTFLCQDVPRELIFSDVANVEGIAGPSRTPLKFGAFFFDYDLDGRLDFLTCNGHLDPGIGKLQAGQRYEQPAQLFWNTGRQPRGFEPVPEEAAGPDLFRPLVGRGCAYADLDGDGDLDVILTGNGGPARVLRDDNRLGHHWIRLKLEGDGVRSNRSAIGARVILEAGGVEQRREVAAARGYLSQSELVVTFGLGEVETIDRITIHWPGKNAGEPTVLPKPAIDREHTIKQAVHEPGRR